MTRRSIMEYVQALRSQYFRATREEKGKMLDEKDEAREYLDFAIKEFREMKMQPSLERALRHKDILKA